MNDKERKVTVEEAISLLPESGDWIHTFRNPNGMLLGADSSRERVIKELQDNPECIELSGKTARGMNHGLVVNESLFIETDETKLNIFDPINEK